MGRDVNHENVIANANVRPIKPFKYDFVEHLRYMPTRLHIIDLLQMSKETRDGLIKELQALNPDNQVHMAQVHQIEKKHHVAKFKRPQKHCEECYSIQNAFKLLFPSLKRICCWVMSITRGLYTLQPISKKY